MEVFSTKVEVLQKLIWLFSRPINRSLISMMEVVSTSWVQWVSHPPGVLHDDEMTLAGFDHGGEVNLVPLSEAIFLPPTLSHFSVPSSL